MSEEKEAKRPEVWGILVKKGGISRWMMSTRAAGPLRLNREQAEIVAGALNRVDSPEKKYTVKRLEESCETKVDKLIIMTERFANEQCRVSVKREDDSLMAVWCGYLDKGDVHVVGGSPRHDILIPNSRVLVGIRLERLGEMQADPDPNANRYELGARALEFLLKLEEYDNGDDTPEMEKLGEWLTQEQEELTHAIRVVRERGELRGQERAKP